MISVKNRFLDLLTQKIEREQRYISVYEVARVTRIRGNEIDAWVTNKMESYPSNTIATLCNYFDCTPGDLFTLVGTREEMTDTGYVYVITSLSKGICKIGMSWNPESRLTSLSSKGVRDLLLLHQIKCDNMGQTRDVEHLLHNKYSEKRFKGEWFHLDAADIEDVRRLKSGEEAIASLIHDWRSSIVPGRDGRHTLRNRRLLKRYAALLEGGPS